MYFLLPKFGPWARWGKIKPSGGVGGLFQGVRGSIPPTGARLTVFVNDSVGLSNTRGSNFIGKMG